MRQVKISSIWLLLMGLLLGLPQMGNARVVDGGDALTVAENFVAHTIQRQGGWGEAKMAHTQYCEALTREDGRLLGYYVPVSPDGFVVVSLLTQLAPVKSYSTTGQLDLTATQGYTQLLRDAMGGVVDFLEYNYGTLEMVPETGVAPASNTGEWDYFSGVASSLPLPDGAGTTSETVTTGGLLQSSWHQGAPYNNSCPYGDGGNSVVGCVATAASQVMNYWRYPYSGTGSHSYSWNGDQSCGGSTIGGTLSANLATVFDWSNILNSYSGGYTAGQAAAVADLCYRVGVAYSMDYGRCGSGAYTGDGVTVYPTYFKYANTTSQKNRSSYSTAQDWFNAIRVEFDAAIPRVIHYRINTHSIVCDGYQTGSTNYIHLNYGWADGHNAWYAVDNLYCPWSGCSYTVEYIVAGIQPLNRLYTLVTGSDNRIYQKYMTYSGTYYTSWEAISGLSGYTPALEVFNNRLYMTVRGIDNSIYITSRTGQFWETDWQVIPGALKYYPALVSFNNALYLFVLGTENALYYKSMNSAGTWSAWTALGGSVMSAPAVTVYGDSLWVMAPGSDGLLYYRTMDGSGSWSAWTFFGGATNTTPTMASFNGSLYVAVKGSDNAIYLRSCFLGCGAWASIGGQTATPISLTVMPQTSRLYMGVKGSDNAVYERYMDTSGTWSAWTPLPGQTLNAPALHAFYFENPAETAGLGRTPSLPDYSQPLPEQVTSPEVQE
jgi:hypothetical protein